MNSEIWGPKAWFFIDTVCLNYPLNPTLEEKNNNIYFFNSLSNILPCDQCKIHYKKYIQENPIENNVKNKISLVKWVLDLHNKVNERNGKSKQSIDKLFSYYENIYTKKSNNKLFLIVIIVASIVLVIYLKNKYIKK